MVQKAKVARGSYNAPAVSLFGGCLPISALIALAFTLVVPDQTLFIPAILAGILAVVLMASGTVPDFFLPAFTFVLADQALFATAFPAVATFVVPTHFNYVVVRKHRQLKG
jgi:hypothetical protein